MINLQTATMLIQKTYPSYTIEKKLDYKDWFIFLLSPDDQDEPSTLFRVYKTSGKVEDFQPWDLPNPQDFEKAFLA